MCDLHLPSYQNAMQYNVLDWAINDIKTKRPDCIVFAGGWCNVWLVANKCYGREDIDY